MWALVLINVATAAGGGLRLRGRNPSGHAHGPPSLFAKPRSLFAHGPRAFVQLGSGLEAPSAALLQRAPELEQLNAAYSDKQQALDAKARECYLMQVNFLVSPEASLARAGVPGGGDFTLHSVQRDLATEQVALARVNEAAAMTAESASRPCERSRVAGAKELKALEVQMHNATKQTVDDQSADDLFEDVLGDLRDRVAHARTRVNKEVEACEQLVAAAREQQARAADTKERMSARMAELYLEKNQAQAGVSALALMPGSDFPQCRAEAAELAHALAGVRRERARILAAGSLPDVFDCEVSDWVEGPCSVTCGEGNRHLRRLVVRPAEGGAACPPLGLLETCQRSCPDDCESSDWSEWGACHEVQTRGRQVTHDGNAEGVPCGTLEETRLCGEPTASCVLGEWQEWSGCSRACGGGAARASRGASSACGSVKLERMKLCNSEPCGTGLACAAAERPVFVLDGSGSLGAARFSTLQGFLQSVLPKLPEAAVLLAGEHVTHVTGFAAGSVAAGAVAGVAFPGSRTSLPAAIEHAVGLGGRTVVLLTDGQVNSHLEMMEASKRAQVSGRVVLVTPENAAAVASAFASSPAHDNVLGLRMDDQAGAVDVLLSMLCTQLA